MNAESIEHYPGYSALVSYLKNHSAWSYSEFLKLHRDVIVSSPPFSDEWNGLDGTWARRFLTKAKDLSPLTFAAKKKKVVSERSSNGLKRYWEEVIYDQKKLAVKYTHIIGSLDLLDKAGKHNTKDLLSKDSSNPFLVSTTIAKNSVEEDAGGEEKMSDQDYEEEDEYTDAQYNIDDLKSKGMLNTRKHGLDGVKTCQLRKKITTMDSTEDLDEGENVPAIVLGDTDGDKIVDAVCIKTNGKVIDGWMLPDGRNVGELFTKYRATVKERDIFAASHIFDLADVALVHHIRSLSDDDELWSEIEDAWDAKWGDYRPSEHVREYLISLRKSSIEDVRSVLMKPYMNDTYNVKLHYDIEYVHTVVRAFISRVEQTINPLLDNSNSEGFWQVHVYGRLVDDLFMDIPEVQIIRGEKASRAVSYRKNSQRQLGETKIAASKLDAAVATRDTWRVELMTMEAGRQDTIEGQSKWLSDRYKLARGLKDQIDFIYKWLPGSQKHRIIEVEVFGVLTSGLEGSVYALDLPCSGLYRFGELFRFELPRQFDTYELLIKALARFLALKARLRAVLEILQDINRTSTTEMLQEPDLFWSPRKNLRTQPTRSTPPSPTPLSNKKRAAVVGNRTEEQGQKSKRGRG